MGAESNIPQSDLLIVGAGAKAAAIAAKVHVAQPARARPASR